MDGDGNGVALNVAGAVEFSPVRTIGRDTQDLNHDTFTQDQLVLTDGISVRVLATGLAPNEDANGNGVLDAGEDKNGNGRLDRGIWFEPYKKGILVTVDTQSKVFRGQTYTASLNQLIIPRN